MFVFMLRRRCRTFGSLGIDAGYEVWERVSGPFSALAAEVVLFFASGVFMSAVVVVVEMMLARKMES